MCRAVRSRAFVAKLSKRHRTGTVGKIIVSVFRLELNLAVAPSGLARFSGASPRARTPEKSAKARSRSCLDPRTPYLPELGHLHHDFHGRRIGRRTDSAYSNAALRRLLRRLSRLFCFLTALRPPRGFATSERGSLARVSLAAWSSGGPMPTSCFTPFRAFRVHAGRGRVGSRPVSAYCRVTRRSKSSPRSAPSQSRGSFSGRSPGCAPAGRTARRAGYARGALGVKLRAEPAADDRNPF